MSDIYRHFRTGQLYRVLHHGTHTETGEQMVIYHLYDALEALGQPRFVPEPIRKEPKRTKWSYLDDDARKEDYFMGDGHGGYPD